MGLTSRTREVTGRWFKTHGRPARPRRCGNRHHHALGLEQLEDRALLSTLALNKTTFGPNETVMITAGSIEFISARNCPRTDRGPGLGDFVFPTADVYIVHGTVSDGMRLADAAGGFPNVVFGGFGGGFGEEIIGYTAPDGHLRSGTYSIVYDQCQDNRLDITSDPDFTDTVFENAFSVVIPPDVPVPSSSIRFMKGRWAAERDYWKAFQRDAEHMFIAFLAIDIINGFLAGAGPSLPGQVGTSAALLTNTFGQLALSGRPGAVAIAHVGQIIRHYEALRRDPPDAEFQQLGALSTAIRLDLPPLDPEFEQYDHLLQEDLDLHTTDAVTNAALEVARSLVPEVTAASGLLGALERFQGADVADDPDWALTHARQIAAYAETLAEQAAVTNDALTALDDALAADSRDFGVLTDWELLRQRIETTGFTAEETIELANLGLSSTDIADVRKRVVSLDVASFAIADVQQAISALIAANSAAISDLSGLAAEASEIVAFLDAHPAVTEPAPLAHAGGPYRVDEGVSVTLDASGSLDPHGAIVSYAWDLDLDGQFDDAQGIQPTVVFDRELRGLVGLEVASDTGLTAIDYARIEVVNVNSPPSLVDYSPSVPYPSSIEIGGETTFTVTPSDPDGDSTSVQWFVDDIPVAVGSTFTYQPTSFDEIGSHTIRSVVSDDHHSGGSSQFDWSVAVVAPDDDGDLWRVNIDCDDANPMVHPGMPEVIGDAIDNDCNPETIDIGNVDLVLDVVDTSGLSTDSQTLAVAGNVDVTIGNQGMHDFDTSVAGPLELLLYEDHDGNARFDLAVDNLLAATDFTGLIPGGGSVTMSMPVAGMLLFRDNLIYAMADAGDTVPETDESNNQSHSGTQSLYQPTADWLPQVQWQWDDSEAVGQRGGVRHEPIVAPLVDTNGDGSVNERDTPAVIIASAFGQSTSGNLVALRGDSGEVIFSVPAPTGFRGFGPIAVGDLEADGKPEIVYRDAGNDLVVYNNDGTLKWRTAIKPGDPHRITLADLDGDRRLEILFHGRVYNYDGTLRWMSSFTPHSLHTGGVYGAHVVADLDLDGTPEVLGGASAADRDGNVLWSWANQSGTPTRAVGLLDGGNTLVTVSSELVRGVGAAKPVVANVDDDPYPEVIATLNSGPGWWILEHDGRVHAGPFGLFEDSGALADYAVSQPTVADLDGDGQVEIALGVMLQSSSNLDVTSRTTTVAYEVDGTLLWQRDLAFGAEHWLGGANQLPPPTAFDFDGDGASELVYLDNQKLHILNGSDGSILFEIAVNALSGVVRYPTIADVDNDGNAEILVPTFNLFGADEAGAPPRNGVLVIGDANDNWVHARRIWNQFAYDVSNIEEDASAPQEPTNSWQAINSHREQVPIVGLHRFAAPDLSVSRITFRQDDCGQAAATVVARVGNGGSLHVPPNVPVQFFIGNPATNGVLIGTSNTTGRLFPGEFQDVALSVDTATLASGQSSEIWATVNAQPAGDRLVSNNLASLPHTWVEASGLGDNGFIVPVNFNTYLGIDGNPNTGWLNFYRLRGRDTDTRDPFYQVNFPFPVTASSVTIDNSYNFPPRGFLAGTLSFSNGFETPFVLDPNGEGTIAFPEQADVTWVHMTASSTNPSGASITEFIVGGSYVQPTFLLNEGDGRLNNNVGRFGFEASPCDPAANVPPTVFAGHDQTIDEGDTFALPPARFVDPGVIGTHTAQIAWGDGTAEPGAVEESGGSGTVAGSHLFAQDGRYLVTVTVTDSAHQTGSDTLTLSVGNLPPTVDAGADQMVDEGTSLSVLASFVDPGMLDTQTATIDWGDGTIDAALVSQQSGAGTASGSHTYGDDGAYTATVCVTDDDGAAGCDSFQVTVANIAPSIEAGGDQTSNEGETVSLSGASFVDAGDLDTHTVLVNWGDTPLTRFAAVTPGSGSSAIDASYEYEDSGTFTVTVCVTDDEAAEACDSVEIVVGNVVPSVTAGFDRTVGRTVSLSPAVFQDAGLADTHTATIDWGDGSSEAGDIFQWRGSGSVSASHTYAADNVYSVQVTVSDDDGGTGSDSFTVTATVANQPPTVQQDATTTFLLGEEQTHAVAILDPNPDDTHTAAIDWGDGSSQDALELKNNVRGFGVGFPAHTYASAGTFDITACATDDRGLTGCNTLTVLVSSPNTPPVAANDEVSGDEDTSLLIQVLADNGHGVDIDTENNIDPSLTVNLTEPSRGVLSNNHDGTFTFDPSNDFEFLSVGESASETFVYQITDAFGEMDSASVVITIVGVNDGPALTLDNTTVTVDEGDTAHNSGSFADLDATDNVSIQASVGTVSHDPGHSGTWTWAFQSADGPDESQSVTITADDGNGGVTTLNFQLTVANVAPSLSDASFTVVENSFAGTPVGTILGTDLGDDTLTYGITGGTGAAALAVDPHTGQITVADSSQLDYELSPWLALVVEVTDDAGATGTATLSINLLNQPSIAGEIFVDVNQNGFFDADELGIDGVLVELLDEFGAAVLDAQGVPVTATSGNGGVYLLEDLDPGTYQLHEIQPQGVSDGPELLGSLGGSIPANDTMQFTLGRTDAVDYNFTEVGEQLASGDTATIGFWHNKHGQALITQGGTELADWLTNDFGNVFGDTFAGGDGGDVAQFFRDNLFRQKRKEAQGPAKVDAQYMAVALAVYFTSSNLAGTVAIGFGFNVTSTGIGTNVVNVGENAAAFGLTNGVHRTIWQLLQATSALTDLLDDQRGFVHIYDQNGDGVIDDFEASLRTMANDVYTWINETGDL